MLPVLQDLARKGGKLWDVGYVGKEKNGYRESAASENNIYPKDLRMPHAAGVTTQSMFRMELGNILLCQPINSSFGLLVGQLVGLSWYPKRAGHASNAIYTNEHLFSFFPGQQ